MALFDGMKNEFRAGKQAAAEAAAQMAATAATAGPQIKKGIAYTIGEHGIAKGSAKVLRGGLLKAGLIGLGAGAVVSLPFVIGGIRESRRFDPQSAPAPRDPEPMPQVMDVVPSGQQTLMGEVPVVGERAQAILRQRAGLSAGVDAGAPSIMRADGRNAIDGSGGVQDLGAPAGRSL